MAVRKLQFKPGVNRETTRCAAEGQWYETDKVRFRRGLPQKRGGWEQVSSNTYLGVARYLFNWATLSLQNLVSVGTHLKYYIEKGGAYNDITPIRATIAAGDVIAKRKCDTGISQIEHRKNCDSLFTIRGENKRQIECRVDDHSAHEKGAHRFPGQYQ